MSTATAPDGRASAPEAASPAAPRETSASPPAPPWTWLHRAFALAVSAFGLALRYDHARTFVSDGRASDYENTVIAIRWVAEHRTFFDVGTSLHNGYHAPLWYVLAAAIVGNGHPIRAVAYVSVAAWAARQLVLYLALREAVPDRPVARAAALALHAVLPISVLMDGKIYNESLHATFFTLALYFLLRIERQARAGVAAVKTRDAALFGLVAGLAMITKSTAVVLLMTAGALGLAWLAWSARGARLATLRATVRPALASAVAWLAAAGWYCGHNVRKFGHPFPHEFMYRHADVARDHPIVLEPYLYRRPIGWVLPFETEYLDFPYGPWSRPNFWSSLVAGTWVDMLNRGFCRMTGGGTPTRAAWRAATPLTERCIQASVVLARIGVVISAVTLVAAVALLRSYARSRGARSSLVVPLAPALVVLFLFAFGIAYPFDHHPTIKANYALAGAPALCAVFAVAVDRAPSDRAWGRAAHAAAFLAIAMVGTLVAGELWFL